MGHREAGIEAKYDKRSLTMDTTSKEYRRHIASLKCCACGSVKRCKCTVKDYLGGGKGNYGLQNHTRTMPAGY